MFFSENYWLKINCFSHLADYIGIPTVVKTNILIRSMGPVSELDMVCESFSFKLKENHGDNEERSRSR